MIKAAFFDVDGTLVSFRQRAITDRLREDLLELRRRGIKIFLTTGRARQDLARTGMMRDVVFDGYVTLNGQCCYNEREKYRDVTICREDLESACRITRENPHIAVLMEGDGASYLNRINDRVRDIFRFLHTDLYEIQPVEWMLEHKVYQFVPLVGPEEERLFVDAMPHCAHTRWHPQGIDIVPQGGSKAAGIRATMEYYGLRTEDIVAFGDGENDAAMLELAGTAVAMGNAIEAVKNIADYVTASVEEDGVSQAFRQLKLLP